MDEQVFMFLITPLVSCNASITSLITEKNFEWDFENKKGLFYNRYAISLTSNSKNQIQVLVSQSTDTVGQALGPNHLRTPPTNFGTY